MPMASHQSFNGFVEATPQGFLPSLYTGTEPTNVLALLNMAGEPSTVAHTKGQRETMTALAAEEEGAAVTYATSTGAPIGSLGSIDQPHSDAEAFLDWLEGEYLDTDLPGEEFPMSLDDTMRIFKEMTNRPSTVSPFGQ